MYNVLLIDDEDIILEGLSSIINWKSYNCMICAKAHSGEEGIEYIKKFHPDIILTDICMRNMSGLEMLESVYDDIKDSQVVIITGYRDFEYAQKAITLGVSDFILKPTKIDELNTVIKKIIKKLENRNKLVEKAENSKNQVDDLKRKLDYIKTSKEVNLDINISDNDGNRMIFEENKPYIVLSFDFDGIELINGDNIKNQIMSVIKSTISDTSIAYFLNLKINNEIAVLISNKDAGVLSSDNITHIAKILLKFFQISFQTKVFIGISTLSSVKGEIINKFLESRQALFYNKRLEGNSISLYSDIPNILPEFSDNDSTECILLADIIISGDKKNYQNTFFVFKDAIKLMSVEDAKEAIKKVIYKIFDANKIISDYSAGENRQTVSNMIDESNNIDECLSLLYDIGINMIDKVDKYNENQQMTKLKKAAYYIENNYMYPLTRSEIADYVGISSNYLSAIFRSGLDMSYVEYLNKIRIEKAKELLINTNKKLFEISDEVGYKDLYYFSKVFKSYTGHSPGEYRNFHKN